jgi:hypothetical protein
MSRIGTKYSLLSNVAAIAALKPSRSHSLRTVEREHSRFRAPLVGGAGGRGEGRRLVLRHLSHIKRLVRILLCVHACAVEIFAQVSWQPYRRTTNVSLLLRPARSFYVFTQVGPSIRDTLFTFSKTSEK